MRRAAACSLLLLMAGTTYLRAGNKSQEIIQFKLGKTSIEGTPLYWDDSGAAVLARDGQVWDFAPAEATDVFRTGKRFTSYSITRVRADLLREFGSGFQVTSSGNYLVVHPRGHGREWSKRFDELYRSFRIYFSVRGFQLAKPQFPMVAIVMRTKQEFQRYMQRDRTTLSPGVLGYYSPRNNRVAMYDVSGGKSSAAWHENAETIIHEATHQTAFNTGIHSRFAPPPRWVAEGLGTLFEARGVWDSRHSARSSARVNRGRLNQFHRYVSRRKPDATVDLISSDRMFRGDPDGAYAESWALTYYLIETRPRKYAAYLARTAKRPNFSAYNSSQRLADFTAVFGKNFRLFDAQYLEYLKRVR